MEFQRTGFTFYRSFYETVADFEDDLEIEEEKRKADQEKLELKWYRAIFKFIFEEIEPNFKERELKIAWRNAKPILEKSNNLAKNRKVIHKNQSQSIENNQNQSESIEINQNQSESIEIKALKRTKTNVSSNSSLELVNNIFKNYSDCACGRVRARTEDERAPFIHIFNSFYEKIPQNWRDDANEIVDVLIEASEQANTPEGLKFNKIDYDGKKFAQMLSTLTCKNFENVFKSIHFIDESHRKIENRAVYILSALIYQTEQNKRRGK